MFTPPLRLILSSLSIVWGCYLIYLNPYDILGWLVLSSVGALVWGYVRYGTIWRAWKQFENNDLDALESELTHIKRPEWLNAQSKAYYHLLHGVILSKYEDLESAYASFEIASKGPLRTENVLSLVHVYLADTAIMLNDVSTAKEHIRKAREIDHNEGVDDMIEQLEYKLEELP